MVVQIDLAPGTLAPTLQCLGYFSFKVDDYVPPPTRCLCCLDLATLSRKQPSATSALLITRTRTALNETNRSARPACYRPHPAMSNSCPKNTLSKATTTSRSGCSSAIVLALLARTCRSPAAELRHRRQTTRATGDQGNAQSTSSRPSGESNRQRSKMLRPNAPALP